MIKFREYEGQDANAVVRINDQSIHRYDLNQPFVLRGVVFDDENNIVGFGGIKTIFEAVIILDQNASKQDRVQAALELVKHGMIRSEDEKIKYWHVFCDDDFAALLEKHFGFKQAEGKALILEL